MHNYAKLYMLNGVAAARHAQNFKLRFVHLQMPWHVFALVKAGANSVATPILHCGSGQSSLGLISLIS